MLDSKIEELKIEKSKLLKVESFLNPDNDYFVYHTYSLDKISGTTGSTPNNLSEILDVVTDAILKYSEYIKKIPNKESSIVKRDRGVQKYAILSTNGVVSAPVTWEEVATDVSFYSLQQYLPMSEYKGGVKSIKIECMPSFRKGGESGTDIDFSVVLLRINPRKNILEEFTNGGGLMRVTIDNSNLFGDDIFIIGMRQKQKIIKTSIYYSNLSYSIDLEFMDGRTSSNVYSIGGTKVGNIIPSNIDNSISDNIVYWSMFTLNDFTVSATEFQNKEMILIPKTYNLDIPSTYDGNTIQEIIVDGIRIDVSDKKISFRSNISERSIIFSDTFKLYDKKDNGLSKIVFKNVVPIDVVLEEAINAL